MKKILSILLALTLALVLVGCGDTNTTSTPDASTDNESYTAVDMSVAYMTGPTGMGMAKLNADSDAKLTANNYTFTVAAAASDITGKFLKGEINVASVPTNVAATLYNKSNGKVRMLAVNTNGVLSILENGNTIKSVDDLKGKTIYSTGKGQNPEYILNYILTENGINPATDVTINFVSSDDLKAKLISGEAEIAMAPEPLATAVMVQNKELNRVLSINDEWSKVSDTDLMMGCVIALDSYVDANPKAIEKFLSEYEASIKFATENIDEAATYCEKYGIAPKAAIAKQSIPISNLCYVTGTDMKTNVNGYFNVLFNANSDSIGGKLPADDLYYKAD